MRSRGIISIAKLAILLNPPALIKAYGGDKAWRLGGIVWALQNDKRDPLKIDRTYSGANRMATYWPDRAAAAESMAATLKREVSALQCQLYSERQTVEALIQKQNGKQGGSLDRELAEHWRALVQLVHPDKHGGSPGATRLTQWLNEIKGRLPCA